MLNTIETKELTLQPKIALPTSEFARRNSIDPREMDIALDIASLIRDDIYTAEPLVARGSCVDTAFRSIPIDTRLSDLRHTLHQADIPVDFMPKGPNVDLKLGMTQQQMKRLYALSDSLNLRLTFKRGGPLLSTIYWETRAYRLTGNINLVCSMTELLPHFRTPGGYGKNDARDYVGRRIDSTVASITEDDMIHLPAESAANLETALESPTFRDSLFLPLDFARMTRFNALHPSSIQTRTGRIFENERAEWINNMFYRVNPCLLTGLRADDFGNAYEDVPENLAVSLILRPEFFRQCITEIPFITGWSNFNPFLFDQFFDDIYKDNPGGLDLDLLAQRLETYHVIPGLQRTVEYADFSNANDIPAINSRLKTIRDGTVLRLGDIRSWIAIHQSLQIHRHDGYKRIGNTMQKIFFNHFNQFYRNK